MLPPIDSITLARSNAARCGSEADSSARRMTTGEVWFQARSLGAFAGRFAQSSTRES
jgi:hypothetical protein